MEAYLKRSPPVFNWLARVYSASKWWGFFAFGCSPGSSLEDERRGERQERTQKDK